jgi:hypothetical protein
MKVGTNRLLTFGLGRYWNPRSLANDAASDPARRG